MLLRRNASCRKQETPFWGWGSRFEWKLWDILLFSSSLTLQLGLNNKKETEKDPNCSRPRPVNGLTDRSWVCSGLSTPCQLLSTDRDITGYVWESITSIWEIGLISTKKWLIRLLRVCQRLNKCGNWPVIRPESLGKLRDYSCKALASLIVSLYIVIC